MNNMNTLERKIHYTPASQQGAVLIVSMVLLLIMTVIGTSSMNSVTLEERMVSNAYDDNLSFQAAEAGLNDCELDLVEGAISPKDKGSSWDEGNAEANYGNANTPWYDDATLWDPANIEILQYDDGAVAFTANLGMGAGRLNAEPLCFRELVGEYANGSDKGFSGLENKVEVWNINVRGSGASGNVTNVVQSTVHVKF